MFKKILVLVALLALIAVPAMAVDGQLYSGQAGAQSSVVSGSGAAFFGVSGSHAGNTSVGQSSVNWGGPGFVATAGSTTGGGTGTFAFGPAFSIAGQSGGAGASAGYVGFHF